MTKTYELNSVQHAVEIGTTLTYSWFRGHADEEKELTPRVFRPKYGGGNPIVADFVPDLEMRWIEQFKTNAPPLATHDVPSDDDRLGWLHLMQHHGAPTRLLDWTENVLAALFFAVSDNPTKPAELWALLPWELNRQAGVGYHLPLYNSPDLAYLAREPYTMDKQALAAKIAEQYETEERVIRTPVAFRPRRDFGRMVVQLSTFTIHPQPSMGNTIPELIHDPKHLVRYWIPPDAKRRITRDLQALGITDATLFPDLDGLGESLMRGGIDVAYTPPEPPQCDGPHRAEDHEESSGEHD